jgi:large subunit ribosomal protein L10
VAKTKAKGVGRAQKVAKVADLEKRIEASQALLLADFRGLSVLDAKELRVSLRDADATFAIVKNSLMRRAVDGAGMQGLEAFLDGPTAVAFVAGDAVLAAKRLAEAAKKHPDLEVKGGFMEGRVLSAQEAAALSKLESREAMLSKVAGLMKSEMSRAASMLQAAQGRFLSLLEAYKDKVPGEPEAAAEPDAPAGEAPAQPADAPEAPDAQETPEAPDTQETPEAPDTQDAPDEEKE